MNKLLNSIPTPIVGLILAIATLGHLLNNFGNFYKDIMGIVAASLFSLVTAKFIICRESLKQELTNPEPTSVFSTYTMSIILLATYIKPISNNLAYAVWLAGILFHIMWMILFSRKYLMKFQITKVYPSWFIVYVGAAIIAVTANDFNQHVGEIAFWFALTAYAALLVLVCQRVILIKQIPEAALPTLIIFAAPGSLCLAGYINSFNSYNLSLFLVLLVISQFCYIGSVLVLIKLLKLKFYPSFSGFTFPLVISALALNSSHHLLINYGIYIPGINLYIAIETAIAILIVIYVLLGYVKFLINKQTCGQSSE